MLPRKPRSNLLLAVTSLLVNICSPACASLTSYASNGVDLVWMQGGYHDVSWTKDGNLLGTLLKQHAASHSGDYFGLINDIISANNGRITDTPNYYDGSYNNYDGARGRPYSGVYTLSPNDFSIGNPGLVNWFGAQAFVNYLNSIGYAGSSQWRLPTWTDTGATGPQFGFSGTDFGLNVDVNSSELARLYYAELGKTGYISPSGQDQNGYGVFGNDGAQIAGGIVGPFMNVLSSSYWSGTEYVQGPHDAWGFDFGLGSQGLPNKNGQFFAWPVTPGQINAVPVPGGIWLMGSALLGLTGLKRRSKARQVSSPAR